MNINESAVLKHLAILKNSGVIERIGGTRGYWKIKEWHTSKHVQKVIKLFSEEDIYISKVPLNNIVLENGGLSGTKGGKIGSQTGHQISETQQKILNLTWTSRIKIWTLMVHSGLAELKTDLIPTSWNRFFYIDQLQLVGVKSE